MKKLGPIALVVVASACSKTPAPEKAAPVTTVSSAAPALPSGHPAVKPAPELAWDTPASFQPAQNTTGMRKASYRVAKAPGDAEDADFGVMVASGGVDANVQRWAGQFGNAPPKTEARTVNGLKVTVVEIKGTFSGGMMVGPSTPKEKQMLLGAIVDMGDQQWFFKMTGPEKTVTAAKPDFDKLVASVRPKA